MTCRVMTMEDIETVLPVYIDYYNKHEDCCWTEKTAGKRIHQVLSMDDSYALILEDNNVIVGFAMGYFEQYDDIISYVLEEIVVAYEYQNKGIGSRFLAEIENRVKEKGAAGVELKAVNDEHHERYYGKADYRGVQNFVLKVKWFDTI